MKNNKNQLLTSVLCAAALPLGLVSTANAALVSTLGGLAVYDTDRNISGLADANFTQTSGFDADGRMTWANAKAWADDLNIGGAEDWRLPTALNADGTGPCAGFNCTDSEMGHLFYNELGGVAGSSILASGDPDLALFSNVQSLDYWSGTEFAPDPGKTWVFIFNFGNHYAGKENFIMFAWAVHSGDVGASAVPEPGTIALMGLGLAGLLGFGRRQHRR